MQIYAVKKRGGTVSELETCQALPKSFNILSGIEINLYPNSTLNVI